MKLACHRLQPLAVAATLGDDGLLPLPESLLVVPWGNSRTLDGSLVRVGKVTLAALVANQAKVGHGEIALDFNHNTYPVGTDGKKLPVAEPVPVAAYGVLSVEAGKGVVFTPTRWTPAGKEFYQGGHYRDLSPVVGCDKAGNLLFCHSVALCRQGQIDGLHAYSAEIEISIETKTESENTMDYEALIKKLLGLPESATPEDITAAAEAFQAKAAPAAAATAADAPDMTALNARLDQIERDNLIALATATGRVIPLSADAIAELPLPNLKTVIAGLQPGQVPTVALTQPGAAPSKLKALSAQDKEVARQLGIAEADFAKL